MARTETKEVRFGAAPVKLPSDTLFTADFVNVVLDDDYGLRTLGLPPRRIVDIGANVGLFSCFAREQFPDAIIHSYEPSPATAKWAQTNTDHKLTTVFVEGVASEDGFASMVELGSSNLARTEASAAGDIKLVGFPTVLSRIGERIDLLKVDCEGAEWDFMTRREWFQTVALIRMEYHLTDGRTLDDVRALANGIGFEIERLVPNNGFGIVWMRPAVRE